MEVESSCLTEFLGSTDKKRSVSYNNEGLLFWKSFYKSKRFVTVTKIWTLYRNVVFFSPDILSITKVTAVKLYHLLWFLDQMQSFKYKI